MWTAPAAWLQVRPRRTELDTTEICVHHEDEKEELAAAPRNECSIGLAYHCCRLGFALGELQTSVQRPTPPRNPAYPRKHLAGFRSQQTYSTLEARFRKLFRRLPDPVMARRAMSCQDTRPSVATCCSKGKWRVLQPHYARSVAHARRGQCNASGRPLRRARTRPRTIR